MKKILSDGTIAEVGLILVVINGVAMGNEPDAITEIIDTNTSCEDTDCNYVRCRWVRPGMDSKWMNENISDLRKATPEEETLYKERYGKEEN